MAITDLQISDTLETDAPSIRYSGREGPTSPQQQQQEMQIAKQIWDGMGPEQQSQFQSFEQFFTSGIWKQILQQMQVDQAQGPETQQGIAGLGPRTEEIEEVGVESLRDGGRIGYRDGSPHSSPATEAYSSMGETDESALMKKIQFLMSEFGMSEEQALRQATSSFRKPLSPPQAPLRPRALLGMDPQGPVEDIREEIGIGTLRGRP